MKKRGSWRGTLIVAVAAGVAWIGCMGWLLHGSVMLAAEQSNSPKEQQSSAPKEQADSKEQSSSPKEQSNSPKEQSKSKEQPKSKEQANLANPQPAPAAVQDPNCPGKDNHALMCRLVNEYRVKHGLKPVQLDAAVTHEAQYWSDQLNRQSACWFLYHDTNYHERMRARFPGRRFRENAACSGSTGGGAKFILQKWIDSSGHRENMLTPAWKTIGVGVTKNIWVIDFTN
jgi:uncharacterized protein YkwD